MNKEIDELKSKIDRYKNTESEIMEIERCLTGEFPHNIYLEITDPYLDVINGALLSKIKITNIDKKKILEQRLLELKATLSTLETQILGENPVASAL